MSDLESVPLAPMKIMAPEAHLISILRYCHVLLLTFNRPTPTAPEFNAHHEHAYTPAQGHFSGRSRAAVDSSIGFSIGHS